MTQIKSQVLIGSTITGQWTIRIPIQSEFNHHLNLDDPVATPNDSDLIGINQIDKTERYKIKPSDLPGFAPYSEVWWQFRYDGSADVNTPTLVFSLWLGAVQIGADQTITMTAGIKTNGQVMWTGFSLSDEEAEELEVKMVSIGTGGGSAPPDFEDVS